MRFYSAWLTFLIILGLLIGAIGMIGIIWG